MLKPFYVPVSGIIHDDQTQGDFFPDGGLQVSHGHVESAVAGHGHDRGIPRRQLGPDGPGQPVSYGSVAAVGDESSSRCGSVVKEPRPVGGKPPVGQ